MPRIISGSAGGRILKAPTGQGTRPTGDRTKEAMFSALTSRLNFHDCHVLDLFSGSGQLGLEALSRGASYCFFVEQQSAAAKIIEENIALCGFADRCRVMRRSAGAAIEQLAKEAVEPFDLVLLDPPYKEAAAHFEEVAEKLIQAELLRENAILVLEHPAPEDAPGASRKAKKKGANLPSELPAVTQLKPLKHCIYGTAMVSFFMYNQLEEGAARQRTVEA